jgi:ERCC4-type nuclease
MTEDKKCKEYSDFTIIQDSREQTPWTFSPDQQVIVAKLDAGDYSIVGLEGVVSIERKTLDDYCNTVIGRKARFNRELYKLITYKYRMIMVEAKIQEIREHKYTCNTNPTAILGRTRAIRWYKKVPIVFCGNRQIAQVLAEKWLRRVWDLETKTR